MRTFSGVITLDGNPLKRVFVGVSPTIGYTRPVAITMTDNNGHFEYNLPNNLDLFVTSRKFDLYIYCHSSVIRVLNYSNLIDDPVIIKANMINGRTVNITQTSHTDGYQYFKILAKCREIYDVVWRQFKPYNLISTRYFPLGSLSTDSLTFSDADFIELTFPDGTVSKLAWVEPRSVTTSYPLIHIKSQQSDRRLFGDSTTKATLLPHELGHAFHFSTLSASTRFYIGVKYLAFLLDHITKPYHGTNIPTSEFVAFIEAVGMFSERFYFFATEVKPALKGKSLRTAFVNDELRTQSLSTVLTSQYEDVGTLDSQGQLSSNLNRGATVEGRVYGAIYLHFAKIIGLKETVELILSSKATTLTEFNKYIIFNGTSKQKKAIKLVVKAWFS